MTDRTFICRCEDVTLADVESAIEQRLESVEEVKRYTGLGTGPCQGKECMAVLAGLLCERGVINPHDLQPFTSRPPTEPVTLGTLAGWTDAHDAGTETDDAGPGEGDRDA